MNTTRFDRLHRIFDEAAKLAPSQWESYLTNACGGDEELLGEARKLLSVCMQATPSNDTDYTSPPPAQLIGPYRVVRQIGSGGMGVVYLAVRDDGAFRKNVAVKLLRSHLASTDLVQRFHQERQVLANLDHPNIARILDGGQTADGMPYYVMEFVDGQPLDRFCDSQTLDLADRIRLFQQLVRAVQYLHENLVVHRDLKHSNILVVGDGTVKLLDFGIAKVQIASQDAPDLTAPDSRMLTPKYASPEQIIGAPVSKLSDIYSLGVILYELLTGRVPHATPSDKAMKDPPPPSGNIREDLQRTPETTMQLRRRIMGDLDQIVLRCLRRDPRQRYLTAAALGEDLQRFLDGRSVEARKEPLPEMLLRFVKRHKLAVGVCGLLLALGGAGAWQAVQAQNQARRALGSEAEVNRLLDVLKMHLDQHPSSSSSKADGKAIPVPLPDDLRKLRKALEQDLPAAWRRPGLTPQRRAMLDRSAAYLQAARAYAAQNQEITRELAAAYRSLGKLYAVGYRDGALDAYNQSAQLLSGLAGGDPAASPYRDEWQALADQIRGLGGTVPPYMPPVISQGPRPAAETPSAISRRRTSAPLTSAAATTSAREETMPRIPVPAASAIDPREVQELRRMLISATAKAQVADDTMTELKANSAKLGQMVHSDITSMYAQMKIALETARQDVEGGDLKAARESISVAEACATRVLKAGGR